MGNQLVVMCSMAALAGLCANPHHQAGEHPNTGSSAVADRALILGKALAAKLDAELDADLEEAMKRAHAHFRSLGEREALLGEREALLGERERDAAAKLEPERDAAKLEPEVPEPKKKR